MASILDYTSRFRHGAKTEGGGPGEAKPRPPGTKLEALSATGRGATVPSRSRGAERFTVWRELRLLPLARWLGRRTSSPNGASACGARRGSMPALRLGEPPLRAGERKPRSRKGWTLQLWYSRPPVSPQPIGPYTRGPTRTAPSCVRMSMCDVGLENENFCEPVKSAKARRICLRRSQ